MLPQASVVTFTNIGKKTEITNPEGRPDLTSHDTVESHEVFEPSEQSRVQEKRLSQTGIIDSNNNFTHENVLDSMRDVRRRTDDIVKKKCPSQTKQIVKRAELPHSGGVRRYSPICKLQPRSSQKKKQDTQKEQKTLPSYAQDDVNFCAVCLRRDPKKPY
ncbi:hypothetical protein COOONC_03648 [Cooperia oncophora]